MHRMIRASVFGLRLTLAIFALAAPPLLLSGCAEGFAESLRGHPYCVDRAGVMQFKVDDCFERTHGHREAMDECLIDSRVPPARLATLDRCVESAQNQPD